MSEPGAPPQPPKLAGLHGRNYAVGIAESQWFIRLLMYSSIPCSENRSSRPSRTTNGSSEPWRYNQSEERRSFWAASNPIFCKKGVSSFQRFDLRDELRKSLYGSGACDSFEDLDDLLMGGQVEVFSGLAVCPKSYYTGGAASSGHAPAVSDDYANTARKADAGT